MAKVKITNYLKNLGKSLVFATVEDTIKAEMPSATEFLSTNADTMKSVYHGVKDYKTTVRRAGQMITGTGLYQVGDHTFKSALEDLKTGNFYNQQRGDDLMMKSMGMDDFDMDFDDDFSMDSDDSPSLDHDTEATIQTIEASTAASTNAIAGATVKSAEHVAGTVRQSTALMFAQQEKLFSGLNNNLLGMHGTLNNIMAFNQGNLQAHLENSRKYFEESSQLNRENNAILKEMLDMQRHDFQARLKAKEEAEKRGKEKFDITNIMGSNGGVDLSAYFTNIKKNAQDELDASPIGILAGMEPDQLKMMLSNPLSFIPIAIGQGIIGKNVRAQMKKLDKTLSGTFSHMLAELHKAGQERDGITGIIGRIFGARQQMVTGLKTDKFEKGPIPFDGITKKAIIDVIPGHLARIEAALTGNSAPVYDYNSGKWTTMAKIKERKDEMEKYTKSSALSEFKTQMEKGAITGGVTKDIDAIGSKKEFLEELAEYFYKNQTISGYNGKYKDVANKAWDNADMSTATKEVYDAISSFNRMMSSIENTPHDTMLKLFDGSQNFAGKQGKGGNLTGVSLLTDSDGNGAIYYLKNIWEELKGIREFSGGFGGRKRKAKTTKSKYKRGSNTNKAHTSSDSKTQSSSDDGDVPILGDENTWAESADDVDYSNDDLKPDGTNVLDEIFGDESATAADKFKNVLKALYKSPRSVVAGAVGMVDKHIYKFFFKQDTGLKDKEGKPVVGFFNRMVYQMDKTFNTVVDTLKKKILDPFKSKAKKAWNNTKEFFGGFVDEDDRESFRQSYEDSKGGFFGSVKEQFSSVKDDIFGSDKEMEMASLSKESRKAFLDRLNVALSNARTKGEEDQIKRRIKKAERLFKEKEREENKAKEDVTQNYNGTLNVPAYSLTTVSPGEAIIPADQNPFNPDIDKASRSRDRYEENKLKRKFIGADGQEILSHADGTSAFGKMGKAARGRLNLLWKDGFGRIGDLIKETLGSDAFKNWSEKDKQLFMDPAKLAGKATAGGGAGALIGTLFAPGIGTIIGGLAGAAGNILKESETVKGWLFGQIGEDGARQGGVFSRKTQALMKKYLPDMGAWGTVGSVAGLLTGFGPVGGVMLGAAIGFAKNNQSISDKLFGTQLKDKDGHILGRANNGILSKKQQAFLKKSYKTMLPGAIAGLVMDPTGGFLTNIAFGAGGSLLLTSDKFQNFMLGKRGFDGKRRGGVLGKIETMLTSPIKAFAKSITDTKKGWIGSAIVKPTATLFKGLMGEIKMAWRKTSIMDVIGDAWRKAIESTVGRPFMHKLEEDVIKPLKSKVTGWLGSLFKPIKAGAQWVKGKVASGFGVLGEAGDRLIDRQQMQGLGAALSMSARERLERGKERGLDGYKYQTMDTKLVGMNIGQLNTYRNSLYAMLDGDQIHDHKVDTIKSARERFYGNKRDLENGWTKKGADDIAIALDKGEPWSKIEKIILDHRLPEESEAFLLKEAKKTYDEVTAMSDMQKISAEERAKIQAETEKSLGLEAGALNSRSTTNDILSTVNSELDERGVDSAIGVKSKVVNDKIVTAMDTSVQYLDKMNLQLANIASLIYSGKPINDNIMREYKINKDGIATPGDAASADETLPSGYTKSGSKYFDGQGREVVKTTDGGFKLADTESNSDIKKEAESKEKREDERFDKLADDINKKDGKSSKDKDKDKGGLFGKLKGALAGLVGLGGSMGGLLMNLGKGVAGAGIVGLFAPQLIKAMPAIIEAVKENSKPIADSISSVVTEVVPQITKNLFSSMADFITDPKVGVVSKLIGTVAVGGLMAKAVWPLVNVGKTIFSMGKGLFSWFRGSSKKTETEMTIAANAMTRAAAAMEMMARGSQISKGMGLSGDISPGHIPGKTPGKKPGKPKGKLGGFFSRFGGAKTKLAASIAATMGLDYALNSMTADAAEPMDPNDLNYGASGAGEIPTGTNYDQSNMNPQELENEGFSVGNIAAEGAQWMAIDYATGKVWDKVGGESDVAKDAAKNESKLSRVANKATKVAESSKGVTAKIFSWVSNGVTSMLNKITSVMPNKEAAGRITKMAGEAGKRVAGTLVKRAGGAIVKLASKALAVGAGVGAVWIAYDIISGIIGGVSDWYNIADVAYDANVDTGVKIIAGASRIISNLLLGLLDEQDIFNVLGGLFYDMTPFREDIKRRIQEYNDNPDTHPKGAPSKISTAKEYNDIFSKGLLDKAKETYEDAKDWVSDKISSAKELVKSAAANLAGKVTNEAQYVWDKAKDAATSTASAIGNELLYIGGKAMTGVEWLSDKAQPILTMFGKAGELVVNGMKSVGETVKNTVGKVTGFLGDMVQGANQWLKSKGIDIGGIGQKVATGAKNAWDFVSNEAAWLTSLPGKALTGAKNIASAAWGRITGNQASKTGQGKYGMGGFFKQTDPMFANLPYQNANEASGQTIGDSGCGPIAGVNAILAAKHGMGSVDPVSAVNYAAKNGYKESNDGTKPGFFTSYARSQGMDASNLSKSGVADSLMSGGSVVLSGKSRNGNLSESHPFGPNPHYVTATGYDPRSNTVTIQDPEEPNDNLRYPLGSVLNNTDTAIGISKRGRSKNILRRLGRSKFGRGGNTVEQNMDRMWTYLKGKGGLEPHAMAGIMGNTMQESTFDPNADNGTHRGLCQWDKQDRWADLTAKFGGDPSLENQVDYMYYEISTGTHMTSGSSIIPKLNGAGDAAQAAAIFEEEFERSGGDSMENRQKYAMAIYEHYVNGKPLPSDYKGEVPAGSAGAANGNGLAGASGGQSNLLMKAIFGDAGDKITQAYNAFFGSSGSTGGAGGAFGGVVGGGNTKAASNWADSMVNSQGYGNNGCTTFVNKYLEQAGVKQIDMYVPNAEEQSKQNKPYSFKPASAGGNEGDVALINTLTSDAEADHVVIADGKGGYWGNSSSSNLIVKGDIANDFGAENINGYIATGGDGQGAVATGSATRSQADILRDSSLDYGAGKYGRAKGISKAKQIKIEGNGAVKAAAAYAKKQKKSDYGKGSGIWDSLLSGVSAYYGQKQSAQSQSTGDTANININQQPATGSLTPEQIMQLLQAIISLLGQIATNTAGGQQAPAGSQAAMNQNGDIGNILQSVQGLLGQNNQNLLSKIGGMISAFGGGMSAQDKLTANLRTLAGK
nr:MAG TPA: Morphogenesis protein 1 wall, phi29, hydrolase, infection [Bacteriophage sp.]